MPAVMMAALWCVCALGAVAQQQGFVRPDRPLFAVNLTATLGGTQNVITSGMHWRIYNEAAEADGSHTLITESIDANPLMGLPSGQYIIHASVGLASSTKRLVVGSDNVTDKVVMNAGGLAVIGMLGDRPVSKERLKISIFVPERGNSEAKLVLANAKAGEMVILPEGTYHIVSTYLDLVGVGALDGPEASNATNSIVAADLKVASGKVVTASLRHRAAVSTLKLVNQPGAEAMANTSFTVLTPGGDVIRELIGAFPSLVLAEGEYVAIARNNGKTYQSNFKVESTLDRDVEIIAR